MHAGVDSSHRLYEHVAITRPKRDTILYIMFAKPGFQGSSECNSGAVNGIGQSIDKHNQARRA